MLAGLKIGEWSVAFLIESSICTSASLLIGFTRMTLGRNLFVSPSYNTVYFPVPGGVHLFTANLFWVRSNKLITVQLIAFHGSYPILTVYRITIISVGTIFSIGNAHGSSVKYWVLWLFLNVSQKYCFCSSAVIHRWRPVIFLLIIGGYSWNGAERSLFWAIAGIFKIPVCSGPSTV